MSLLRKTDAGSTNPGLLAGFNPSQQKSDAPSGSIAFKYLEVVLP
jgi:hypothetical protein